MAKDAGADEMARALDTVGEARNLALDTESDSFFRYKEKVCLIQISTRAEDFLLDPLAHGLPDALRTTIEDRDRIWVLHGADFDVLSLRRDYDVQFGRLFDTMIAARFLGRPSFGLAAMLESELGVRISKAEQRSDWARRPLSPKQIRYARQDTMHLLPLADRLVQQLEAMGRLAWVEEECEILRQRVPVPKVFDPFGWLKIRGAKGLPDVGRRVVRAAYLWREGVAERVDKAPFRVLSNEGITGLGRAVAEDGVEALERIRSVRGIPQHMNTRGLVTAVRKGIETTDSIPNRRPPSAKKEARRRSGLSTAGKQRLDRIKALREKLSDTYGLEPGLLLPTAICETLARESPSDATAMADLPGMTRWRVQLVAKSLLETL